MSVPFYGDYDTTETVNIPFNTFSSDDPSASVTITNLAAGDIEIHKDGSTTQRSSDNGVTVSIDFDSITGNHMAHIDLSDNTDAGYYAAGSRYQVRMEGTTVDGATINAWIGSFSIGCTLRPTTAGRTLDVESGGCAGVDWGNVANPTTAVDLSATDIQLCDTVTTNTDLVSAADVVNEWESQSQADPTGFHVNVKEVNGTAQTANDNSADINTLITEMGKVPKSDGAVSWNATALAAIEAEALDALESVQLDHLLGVDTGVVADGDLETYCVAGSVMSHLLSSSADATLFKASTDSLQAFRDHVGNGSNLTEAGGDGDHLTAINLPNQTMDITGSITGNLVGDVTGNVDGTVAGVTPEAAGVAPTAAEVADAVWDEDESGHTAADSMGQWLRQIKIARINKQEITESNGNTTIYEDDDSTPHCTVNAAYTSDSTTTTRKRLE